MFFVALVAGLISAAIAGAARHRLRKLTWGFVWLALVVLAALTVPPARTHGRHSGAILLLAITVVFELGMITVLSRSSDDDAHLT